MSKKKGLTLIEIVVAISCCTIFLGTLLASFYFINKMNTDVINKSSDLYKISSIKDYINDNNIYNGTFNIIDGDVSHNNKTICFNSSVKDISFIKRNVETKEYTYCVISYGQNEIYEFLVE